MFDQYTRLLIVLNPEALLDDVILDFIPIRIE